jgi:transposase
MGRYDLTDAEWKAIESHLPNKVRGVKCADDRKVLNWIFWALRSCSARADAPERYGPRTTLTNRFSRWRKAGHLDRLMDAIVAAHEATFRHAAVPVPRVAHVISSWGPSALT